MVRGVPRLRRCAGSVVFVNDAGVAFCASHAKGVPGYTPPPSPKYTFVVRYTLNGVRSFVILYDKKNDRGARLAFARMDWLKGAIVDSVVVKPAGTTVDSYGNVVT